jgi:hypothetical protein
VQRSAQRLHNLLEVDRAILQQHTPAEVAGVALGRLHGLLNCHRVSIAQFDLGGWRRGYLSELAPRRKRSGARERTSLGAHMRQHRRAKERTNLLP